MTVPATSRRAGPFIGNGSTTVFPFAFRVFAEEDVSVTLLSGGVETVLTLGVHYSVAVHVDQDVAPGGAVTYPLIGAPMGPSATLFVVGALPYDQTADLPAGGSFSPRALENALDRGVMQSQQLAERLDRALSVAVSDSMPGVPNVLPPLSSLEGQVLGVAGGRIVGVVPASGSAAELALDLAGPGGADQVGYLHPAFGAVMRALSGRMDELVHVTDFMTDAQRADVLSGSAPTLDSSAAMAAAWAYVQTRGGTLMLPAGGYLWNAQITLPVTAPHNIKVMGWGARIYSGAAVTGAAVRVLGSFNEYQLDIEGLTFDHRGNTTAGGCIALVGAHCAHVSRITLEFSSVKAGYTFIELATSNPGASEDDYNAFWNKITGCSTRKRAGAEPGAIAYGIRIRGTANATTIRDNVLSHCDYGVYGEPAGTTQNLANAVLIEGNHFETLNTAAVHVQMNPGTLGPTGWRLAFNRVETTATFFSLATGGAAALPHSAPPFLIGNYCTTGSVTNWVVNPTSYPVSALESRYPGFGPAVDSVMWQAGSFKIVFPTGGDLYLNNASGSSDYTLGKLFFGTYSVRVNPGDGKLYIKNGQPANATDGVVAGTQT